MFTTKLQGVLSVAAVLVGVLAASGCKSPPEPTEAPGEPVATTAAALSPDSGSDAGPASPSIGSFALYATEAIEFNSGSLVTGCSVGVENTTGPFLGGGAAAYFNSGAKIQSSQTLYAYSTYLNSGASLGPIDTDKVMGNSGATHGTVSTFPAMPAAPGTPAATAGTTAVTLNSGATRTLAAGLYGSVTVNSGAKLTLTGGTYVFSSLTLNSGATLSVSAATTLSVTGAASFNSGSFAGPAAGSGLTAKALVMYFDSSSGIALNSGAQVQALFVATKALVTVNTSKFTGALAAAQVVMNSGATVTCQDGFGSLNGSCSGSCDDGNACTTDACSAGTCTHTPVADGTTCTGTNACEQTYACQAGACTGSNPVVCTASDQCHVAGTCDPASGACSNPTATNGTSCNDGNACTQSDACESGTCTGSNPVTCTAEDQCHTAGTCNPSTGACSNPTATNGTSCNDGNACTLTDSCQSGTCTGSSPVTCVAGDQCHAAGTCDPTTGACSNPALPNGTSCNDGNACTLVDSCQAGLCAGTSPVTCTASDQCHAAGTCNQSTGACSNPTAANGTTCSDGNACTQTDSCQSGTCTGSNPVTCTASDQCHVAGTCSPSTGACSNPTASNGTTCSDGNSCTQTDACQNGTCNGSNPVTCTASDQCHVAGTCNTSTGACSNPTASNGTTCSDGNACTQTDTCQSGTCAGSNPVTCTASDQCHVAGTCNASTGACTNPTASNGSTCNDGDACTQTDACQNGTCTGSSPVTCTASDQCHVAGTCNASTGACSNPAASNGTSCNDGNACTQGDACQNGTCTSSSTVTCTASDQCHLAGACDPGTGQCSNPAAANGATCNDGNACTQTDTCSGGFCTGTNPIACPGPAPLLVATASMSTPRSEHAATLLRSGDILVTGGTPDAKDTSLSTAEVYSVATSSWAPAASMSSPRYGHTATLLVNGQVLVAGGIDNHGNLLATAELYDPVEGVWTSTGSMSTPRYDSHAVRLSTGNVLVVGTPVGLGPSSELFNPSTGVWAPIATLRRVPPFGAGHGEFVTLLADGRVLVAGGSSLAGGTTGASIYNPTTNAWTNAASMPEPRGLPSGALLPDGNVILAGGVGGAPVMTIDGGGGGSALLSDSVLYNPKANLWSPGGTMSAARQSGAGASLPNGIFFFNGGGALGADLFNPATGQWSVITSSTDRTLQTAVETGSGAILVAGGLDPNGNTLASAELFSSPDSQCSQSSCNPQSGACTTVSTHNGSACNNGDACLQIQSCEGGYCVASSPVTCPPAGPCQLSVCNPTTGTCAGTPIDDGMGCSDGNLCSFNETCLAGICSGTPITCVPTECHSAGTCNPTTGGCSNPAASDGTTCSGTDACLQSFACVSGTCTGSSPVACTASDQCHTAGTCDPVAGCSNPAAADGTACTGTNPCFQSYACAAGSCTGSSPVTCTASDQCHVAGTCDPTSGLCSNSTAPDGTACNDGNPCDINDACLGGVCVGTPGGCDAGAADAGSSSGGSGSGSGSGGSSGSSGGGGSGGDAGSDAPESGPPSPPPTWPAGSVLTAAPTGPTSLKLAWTAAIDPAGVTGYEIFANGHLSATVTGSTQSYFLNGLTAGLTYRLAVQAGNATGSWSTDGPTTVVVAQVPLLSVAAPPIDRSVPSSTSSIASFLYSGLNPIQIALATTIAPQRIAILQGRVVDGQGTPLPGAAITVADHPEYGYTISRVDGHYDLAVNGGGSTTLSFDMTGALHAERTLSVPWNRFVPVPDVALITLDAQVTEVDLSGGSGTQIARASTVTDSRGTRQATLIIPAGTTATMTMPDGSAQALTSAHVHATEYTVGAMGPAAMPAALPATSGYTYAVELTADEAQSAEASHLTFSTPIPMYTENFLALHVGQSVPVGYYDTVRHQWVSTDDGRIVQILSVNGTVVALDVDGNQQAATSTELGSLGITTDELAALANIYQVGQSLWRIPLPHFSCIDGNYPIGPPPGGNPPNCVACQDPNPGPGDPRPGPGPKPRCPSVATGCVVNTNTRALGETAKVAGTDMTLNYQSDRTPGFTDDFSLTIPITAVAPPAPLQSVTLEVSVAGENTTTTFSAAPNQTFTFHWDGRDGYGRLLQGSQPIKVRLGYVYKGMYLKTPAEEFDAQVLANHDFAQYSFTNEEACSGCGAQPIITGWYEWDGVIGHFDERAEGLGGWSISPHHAYDTIAQAVYYGTGRLRPASALAPVITTVGGTGFLESFNGDGVATKSSLSQPTAVAVAPDGTIVVLDSGNYRVRQITTDGLMRTVVGTGTPGFSGDGGPATSAQFGYAYAMALGPDGSLYLADPDNHRVRRVSPQGIISTFAGSGTPDGVVEGVTALQAGLVSPYKVAVAPDGTLFVGEFNTQSNPITYRLLSVAPDGYVRVIIESSAATQPSPNGVSLSQTYLESGAVMPGLSIGLDGTVYFGDVNMSGTRAASLRELTPSGVVNIFAGNGTLGLYQSAFGNGADGDPAIGVPIAPCAIATGPAGAFYFADVLSSQAFIRTVLPDGTIRTIAGFGGSTLGQYGGGVANSTPVNLSFLSGLAVAPDGTVVFADTLSDTVRRIAPPIAGTPLTGYAVADDSSSAVFEFDYSGRHLRTVDAYTAATLFSFAYDSAGRLTEIADMNGDITAIVHDQSGQPAQLVSPFGLITTMFSDGNGYLSSIAAPDGDTHGYTYDATGLLLSETTPRLATTTYSYDALGHLAEELDPMGGVVDLVATISSTGTTTARTSAMGFVSTYELDDLSSGASEQVVTDPDGLRTTVTYGTDGTDAFRAPDGTTVIRFAVGDPRFSSQNPLFSTKTSTPAGLTRTSIISRAVGLADPSDPLSLKTETVTRVVNGQSWTDAFAVDSLTRTTTTPVGRQTVTTMDAQDRPIQYKVPGNAPLTIAYDSHGRVASLGQGANTWTRSYDNNGFLASLTDALGQVTSFANDSVGRPVSTTLPDGRLIGQAFDPDSNQTGVTLSTQSAHGFAYTPVDLVSTYTPPSLGAGTWSTQYTYDLDRRPTLEMRPDGVTLASEYDAAGRLRSITTPTGVLSFAFDPITGHMASSTAPGGETLTYSYDGFLRKGVTWSGPVAGSLTLGFDNNFRVTSQAIDGVSLPFAYDSDGLLVQAGVEQIALDPQNGRRTGTTLGSVTDAYTYDGNGLFATYVAQYAGSGLYSESVVRDANGRITQKTEVIGSTTHVWAYSYDVNGRLTDVTEDGQFASHYGYDADDNRTTYSSASGTVNPTYDAQDRLLAYGSTTYAYTANGQLTGKTNGSGATSYTYDTFGNLLNATPPSGPIAYIVDGENRRVGKKVGGTLTQGLLYKDALNVVVQLDGSGNVVSRFVFGSKPNVPDYFTSSAGTFRILSDHLGSPRLIVNATSGNVAEQIEYDEFGNVTNDTSPGLTPFGFAGGLYDPVTGLVRFGKRDYDASAGRWTAKDPLRFHGGQVNLYVYSRNDPVNRRDPSGLYNFVDIFDWSDCHRAIQEFSDVEDYCRKLVNQLCNCAPQGAGLGPAICGPEGEANGTCGPESPGCLNLGVEPTLGCMLQTDPSAFQAASECEGSGYNPTWADPLEEGARGLLLGE